MSNRTVAGFALALIFGIVTGPGEVRAQVLADYTATPPFISQTVPPNILLLMDNSGSMNNMAYDDGAAAFDPTRTYNGLFDALECYQYDGAVNKFVPDPAANPAVMPVGGWTCQGNATHEWSGNLLNFAGMRRIDIAKWVMIGGMCAVPRAADLTCSSVKAQDLPFVSCCRNQTQAIPIAIAQDRMPSAFIPSSGNVYFHLKGSNANLRGKFCVDEDSTAPSSSASDCQDGGAFIEGEFTIRADQQTNSTGVIQQVGGKARFGVMEFSTLGSDGGVVQSGVGSSLATMVAAIQNTRPETWTPLSESLYEASRYFAQLPPAYNAGDYTYTVTAQDPYHFNAPQWAGTDQFAPCCQSFAIVFTDGESTQDLNLPVGLQTIGVPAHGLPLCTGAGCAGHRTDYPSNGSHYLDDIAYWAHTSDLRQATVPVIGEPGKALSGTQSLTTYTFYAFGNANARELLHTTAMLGAFDDRNGNGVPDPTGQSCTYLAGSPFGTGSSTSSAEWDANQDCVADAYYESSDADDLRDRLMAAITSILQRSSSGSAASVLTSSATGEGALYQSFFFPSTFEGQNEIVWTGYAQGLFLDGFGNLREDTNGDGRLVYGDDKIVKTRFDSGINQVVVDRFDDSDGNGIADSPTATGTVALKDMDSIWEAGERLALNASSTRTIKTWVDLDGDGSVNGAEWIDFTSGNAPTLAPYLRADASGTFTADNIVNFIRGDQIAGMRNRELTVGGSLNVWKLGDAIHAQPTVVGAPAQRYDVIYGDSSYTSFFSQYNGRRQVVYLGANDGMLHAFNAGYFHGGDDPSTTTKEEHGWFTRTPTDNSGGPLLGEELFGFVPQELLSHLRWLTRQDYTHAYYVDLKPKVTDARIFTPDPDHPNGWGTILMGGFRLGGSCGACAAGTGGPAMTVTGDFDNDAATADTTRTFYSAYFVLDITNPESSDYPKLLWSYSSSDLGMTTSVPSMLRVSPSADTMTDDTNAKWYMVMGSGPTGYDGSITQAGKMFAMDLKVGTVDTLPAESADAFMGDTLTIDRNLDYRVDVTYVGSSIDDGTTPPWGGKIYRLTMNTCATTPCTTGIWGINDSGDRVPTEVIAQVPAGGGVFDDLGPIPTAPSAALDDTNNLWVFSGTGRLYDVVDKTSTDQQFFFGVKDSVMNSGCTETTRTSCHDDDLVDVSSAQICLLGVGDCGTAGNEQVTGVTGATDFPSLINLVKSKDGWFTRLSGSGERVLAKPLVFGGLVIFPTFTATNDVCTATGTSQLYALYYLTGSAYSSPVIGTTSGSGGKEYVNKTTGMGQGVATEAVVHVGQGGAYGRAQVLSTNSLSQVFQLPLSTTGAITSRFVSWYLQHS